MNIRELLEQLTSAAEGAPGEQNIAQRATELLSQYGEVTSDPMGNLLGHIPGRGRHILLDAHLDEISFVVTRLEEGGFLRVGGYGGVDARVLPAKEMTVWGKQPVTAVFTAAAPHLTKSEECKKAISLESLFLDTGLTDEELEQLVSPGDRVTFCTWLSSLAGNRVAGKSLDDRAGMAVILRALELMRDFPNPPRVTALFSVQEELGTRGAAAGAFGAQPDEAVAVDVSFALQPDAPAYQCGEMSKGPMIGISPTLDRTITGRMKELAERESIPFQLEVMPGETGTNADAISGTRAGIPASLLSLPLRSMHTPAEVVDTEDLENTAQLLAAYLKDCGSK